MTDLKNYEGKAISYVRFSRANQSQGDSLRRQTDLFHAFCEAHNLEPLDTYRDLGVSGYKGKNIEQGALGDLLNNIKAGKIEKGTYLVIESFDRISRADIMTQFEVFIGILQAGVNIVSLSDNGENGEPKIHWGKGSKNEEKDAHSQMINIIITLSIFVRSNNESALKSHRSSQDWKQKRIGVVNDGLALPHLCTNWLDVKNDEFVLLDKQVEVVKKIFKMYESGMGYIAIATQLIKDKVPYQVRKTGYGKQWTASSISSIINNKAVYGLYENNLEGDKKIVKEGYYPVIIEKDEYLRIVGSRNTISKLGGENTKFLNVFRGVAKCECGRGLSLKTGVGRRKDGSKTPAISYLNCPDCKKVAGRLDTSLEMLRETLLEKLLAYRNNNDADISRAIQANNLRRGEIKELEQKLAILNNKVKNLGVDSTAFEILTDRIIDLSSSIDELNEAMEPETARDSVTGEQIHELIFCDVDEMVETKEQRIQINQFLLDTLPNGIVMGKTTQNEFYQYFDTGFESLAFSPDNTSESFKSKEVVRAVATRKNHLHTEWTVTVKASLEPIDDQVIPS